MVTKTCQTATRCHEVAAIVTKVVMALVRERAVDGQVSLEDIERVVQLLNRGTIALDETFRHHQELCRHDHTRPKGNIGARSNPFQRLMVRPFEHLLSGEHTVLQRAYLPHYFEFLEHALGERFEAFERHSRAIIQALLVVHGNNLTWDNFYADQRTIKTLHGALKVLAHYLGSAEGQRVWHGCMVRPAGDLPAPTIPQINQIRHALLETAHGLAAAD
jgi:hypothetical protein